MRYLILYAVYICVHFNIFLHITCMCLNLQIFFLLSIFQKIYNLIRMWDGILFIILKRKCVLCERSFIQYKK